MMQDLVSAREQLSGGGNAVTNCSNWLWAGTMAIVAGVQASAVVSRAAAQGAKEGIHILPPDLSFVFHHKTAKQDVLDFKRKVLQEIGSRMVAALRARATLSQNGVATRLIEQVALGWERHRWRVNVEWSPAETIDPKTGGENPYSKGLLLVDAVSNNFFRALRTHRQADPQFLTLLEEAGYVQPFALDVTGNLIRPLSAKRLYAWKKSIGVPNQRNLP